MIRFSIIIVAYNSQEHIKQCLDSIFKQDFTNYEIIVINNASSDNTSQILDEYKTKIRIKNNARNLGFSAGVNAGISLSTGEYVLTLNPDVVLENNFLSEINDNISKMSSDIGMMGVKLLKADSARLIDSTGLILARFYRFFDRGSGEKDKGQYDKNTDILGPCAAAAIYKRQMLNEIKINEEYFDNDFFYLIEDFDIALRAKRKGWKCIYLPNAVGYHERNGSKMAHGYRQYYSFRNRYFLIIKNIKISPLFVLYFIVYDIPRFIFLLFTNYRFFGAIIDVGQSFKVMLEKRKRIINPVSKNINVGVSNAQ
jgi:GT2 family glycosyltransferase